MIKQRGSLRKAKQSRGRGAHEADVEATISTSPCPSCCCACSGLPLAPSLLCLSTLRSFSRSFSASSPSSSSNTTALSSAGAPDSRRVGTSEGEAVGATCAREDRRRSAVRYLRSSPRQLEVSRHFGIRSRDSQPVSVDVPDHDARDQVLDAHALADEQADFGRRDVVPDCLLDLHSQPRQLGVCNVKIVGTRTMWMLCRYSASGEREWTDDDEKIDWSSSDSDRSMM